MRSLGLCCLLALLVACAREEPADSATADSAATAAPAAPSLAGYAGTWNMETMGMGSDSVLVRFTMTATADSTGWVYNFPGKAPVPIRILSVENGAVMSEAGPYDSNLRPGTPVSIRVVTRVDGDTLTGDVVATFQGGAADSVLNLRTRGTRAQ